MNSIITVTEREQLVAKLEDITASAREFDLTTVKNILAKIAQIDHAEGRQEVRKVCRARPKAERGGDLDDLSYMVQDARRSHAHHRRMYMKAFEILNCATMAACSVLVDGCTWGPQYSKTTAVRTAGDRNLRLTLSFTDASPILNAAIREAIDRRKGRPDGIAVYWRRSDEIRIEIKSYYQRGDVIKAKVQRTLDAVQKEAEQLLQRELIK